MKKVLFVAALLLGTVAMAQEGKERAKLTPEERCEKKMEKMDEQLDLSDDQVAKIKAIHMANSDKMEAKRAEMKKLKDEMKVMRDASKAEIEKVLTDDQKEKLKEIEAKRKAKKAEHKAHGPKKEKGQAPRTNAPVR